tara:strand:+ start:1384 stop:2205 length:822 start_codon:yes stop_codon:yes gene_type:complete
MDKKCAPGKNFKDGSCFTLENLIEISENFNKTFPNNSFPIRRDDKKYLLRNLTSRMKEKYNCDNQVCWINTSFVKNIKNSDITHFTFRPNGPKGKYDWLSTSDIDKVMKQYESKYKDFKFLGAVPYDFEDLSYLETYNFNIENAKVNGKNKIGMVINLDTHDKDGSHWVAFYSNLKTKKVYFFDSFAKQPGSRIKKFAEKFFKDFSGGGNTKNNSNNIVYNQIRHQFNNSECGVYSMNFIIRLLHGETFNDITENITKDTEMNACRKSYFRNN